MTGPGRRRAGRTLARRGPVLAAVLLLLGCAADGDPPSEPPPDPSSQSEPVPDGVRDGDPVPEGDGDDAGPEANAAPEPTAEPPSTEAEARPDLSVPVTLTSVGRLDAPTAAAVGPDGALYLTSRPGTVHRLQQDGVGDAVVDIRDDVSTGSERGLLGIAFAPDGDTVYLSYTDTDGDSRLDAFGVAGGSIDASTRRNLMTVEQPYGNHNGGDIRFGPDDMLYVGLGDGGGSGDPHRTAQDPTTPLGSLLRLDPDAGDPYAIPDDNPFAGDDDARGEIHAYGLRNPWRFSFDRADGDLWIADVGQDSREEINRVAAGEIAGANFGWSLMEGDEPFAGEAPEGHVPPVHTYETTDTRCAITGGYVYRGDAIPELRGAYLFSDFCDGIVRAIVVDQDGTVTDEADLGIDGGSVVSFAQDGDGELYVMDLGGNILRLDPA